MDYFNNMPNYYNNMYYDNGFRNSTMTRQPMPVANRFVPGASGFILPFALGFATAPLVLPRPRPYYPIYQPYPPYYYNYPVYR